MTQRTLSAIVHGDPGVGKSNLADTAPAPRLFLDAEGGTRFLKSGPKITWNPMLEAPPVYDGSWETCVVNVQDFMVVDTTTRWIESRQHPFRSFTWDTLTEIQQRNIRQIAGIGQPTMQQWGETLRTMADHVRRLRDATIDPSNPLEVLIIICQTNERGTTGKQRPSAQGQLGDTLPQFTDLVAYMYTQHDQTFQLRRALRTQPLPNIIAKDRTGRLEEVIWDPSIPAMLDSIYGPAV